jgi:hypothetical protein
MEHNPNPQIPPAATPAGTTRAGTTKLVASYTSNLGRRRLVAQRVNGKVAISDIPATDDGRVYLVERHVSSIAELDALVSDYCRLAAELDRPPMAADWMWQ